MVSASVRAYADGADTVAARRRILLDYLNSLPLGALRGFGDVNGIGDGLAAWYGAGFATANVLLREPQDRPEGLAARGLALRQVLSLLIAQRRPSFYFGAGQRQLGQVLDSYLRLLGQAGVIVPALRDAALQARLVVRERYREPAGSGIDFDERKAASLLRIQLSSLLEVPSLYDLDRLDLQTVSTIDGKVQADVTTLLNRLREPEAAKAAGLLDKQLLQRGDPSRLLYSFALYESGDKVNRVRVQTDNLDQPFDINNGAKLELGSTAKLRTLVSYLEIIASLHTGLAGLEAPMLAGMKVAPKDRLTRWAVDYLRTTPDKSLPAMLEAAMLRRYSANPGEAFFTGGGLHTFANFKPEDNSKTPNLYEALRDSVNLVFIRLMRDVVHHYIYRDPSSAARILEDPDHPDREALLSRFADREGAQFMRGFYRKYRGQKPDKVMETLIAGVRPTPLRLAVIFRSLEPGASSDDFAAFVAQTLPAASISRAALDKLFTQHAPSSFSLSDRGYLAHVHPLELLVAAHLRKHADATLAQVLDAGAAARREVYSWLFRTRARSAQDTRIQSLLELDAFVEIHKRWQRVGYPFASLVPSYATAIGSSGDRPAALAELMGIVVNQGLRQHTVHLEELQFGSGTPYETRLQRQPAAPEQVLPPEVTATVRKALALVVNEGTAKRIKGVVRGANGEPMLVGGKTGTGDNRINTYGAGGAQTGSRAINRTATFVFFLGDRHFGTLTAYVPGKAADDYRFTSALPVQILKEMAPLLRPVVGVSAGEACLEGSNAFKLSREIRLEQQATQVGMPQR
jgi:membrane peptidoglycan carboxypeptidase